MSVLRSADTLAALRDAQNRFSHNNVVQVIALAGPLRGVALPSLQ